MFPKVHTVDLKASTSFMKTKVHTVDLKTSTSFMFHEEQQPLFIPILERFAPYNKEREHLISPIFSSWILWVLFSSQLFFLRFVKLFHRSCVFVLICWVYVSLNDFFSILNYHLLLGVKFYLVCFFNSCVKILK